VGRIKDVGVKVGVEVLAYGVPLNVGVIVGVGLEAD